MRKIVLLLALITVVIGVVVYMNRFPALPFEGAKGKEVIEALERSEDRLVKVGEDEANFWYMTRYGDNGMAGVDAEVKVLLERDGWEFVEKDGSGLFFTKDDERLIATTQMWTSDYVLVKIPNTFPQ
ncbi:type II toxin-antitoxin system HicA family toxin [Sporosarcina sp. OR05]|uniref:type II toxin-antitoxin system HicA family toxin n=1 Tax=Sporosarcina sp. OR05 TaxID=2969819 RepID=UPI00352AEB33